jgi:DNA-binding NtrC family response regulator
LAELTNHAATPKKERPAKSPIAIPVRQTTLKTISEVERDVILQMLKDTGWNKLEAATRLGIGRQTLYNKIALYGLIET